jgi:hypothetical protein
MKRYLKTKLVIALLLFSAFVLGCTPETRIMHAPSKPDVVAPPQSPISVLDNNIAYLEGVLLEKDLTDKDTETAEDLLSAYRMVRDYFLGKGTGQDYDRVIRKLYETLVRLDRDYFLKQEKRKPVCSETITALSESQETIRDKYFSGDYQGVIDDTTELKASFGLNAIPLDIRLLLAVSLAKSGRLEEAAAAGETALLELEERPDLAFILTHIIDVIRDKCFSGDYQGVIDDAIELKTVFGVDAISVDIGFLLAVSLSEIGMKEEANILGSRLIHEFEARPDLAFLQSRLIEWQLDLGNREMVLQIYRELRDHMDEIMEVYKAGDVTEGLFKDLVEQRIQREKEARLHHEKEALIRARELIHEEQYEKAIRIIDELRDEQDMTEEMKELRDLAIEEFINQERNRAAAYLLRGRQTTDPDRKKQFFLLSYNRLKTLTEQYPQSSLVETLKKDMETVETELDRLDKAVEY